MNRVFAGRIAGMVVLGPDGESIGRVRDIVVTIRPRGMASRTIGLVVQVAAQNRQIFVPMLRVASIDPREITLVSGSVNLRPYQSRVGELRVMSELVGSKIHIDDPEHEDLHGRPVDIADVEIEKSRTRDWIISRVAVSKERNRFGRRPPLSVVEWNHVHGLSVSGAGPADATAEILAEFDDMRPADIAQILHDLPSTTRNNVASELEDARLADILQELPEDEQMGVLETFDIERAADVLEEMDPDDAADLLGEMPDDKADVLLELMDPEESEPVRRLMSFSPETVGGLMTSEPIILTPQATVAEALAHARNPDLSTSLSSMVYVVRPPKATPTGKYLGTVHIQKLLREAPSTLVSSILDPDLPPLFADDTHETAARYFATYNLVCGPVLDEDNHLLGAVAVDDLLDHLLPEGWREQEIRPEAGSSGHQAGTLGRAAGAHGAHGRSSRAQKAGSVIVKKTGERRRDRQQGSTPQGPSAGNSHSN